MGRVMSFFGHQLERLRVRRARAKLAKAFDEGNLTGAMLMKLIDDNSASEASK